MSAPIKLTADERRLVNAFRTADRRGRRQIVAFAANVEAKHPRSGKAPPLLAVGGVHAAEGRSS